MDEKSRKYVKCLRRFMFDVEKHSKEYKESYKNGKLGLPPPDFLVNIYLAERQNIKQIKLFPRPDSLKKGYSAGLKIYCKKNNINNLFNRSWIKSIEDLLNMPPRFLGFNSGVRLEPPPELPNESIRDYKDVLIRVFQDGYISGFIIGIHRDYGKITLPENVPLEKSDYYRILDKKM